ncbi:tRNA-uridine aminocarboxypropyltransferase A [Mercurialis annua]|uniref:tRNA-uridine aminocarboxypropyltransferase A n=1 Tax=Mercurialis annua TaxID=3986 RepID=UPI00215EEEFD|nr:tRNA-uridine aminocarboxypropyltransferase A [Mercurialis annua]
MELKEPGPEASPPSTPQRRRSVCNNCDRPIPVCLCHVIPVPPIQTNTQIIIIQHPHESNHKLSTTPLLTKSLLNATSLTSQRLTLNLLRRLPPANAAATFYLFPPTPTSPAITLTELKKSIQNKNTDNTPIVLIAFDATWKHAKEMVSASEGYLSTFATRVCLNGFDESMEGGSIYDSELVLRKEPFSGCVSTLEAVARWLGAVETNGPVIEERLITVLREMVRLQAQFLKPMKPRPKLLNKKKNITKVIEKQSEEEN